MKGIQLFVGQTRTLDAKLQVGAVATQVEVQAEAAALETSNVQVGNVIENRQLSYIPANGRNWATLQMLSPGAINVGGGDQHSIRFNGRGLDDNNYTFDGIDATGVQEQAQKADARLNISLHCCPGDEFWIPASRLIGRELGGVSAFPDLNFFWADLAQNRPSGSGAHHRQ